MVEFLIKTVFSVIALCALMGILGNSNINACLIVMLLFGGAALFVHLNERHTDE
jgi:hypothetical protein